MDSKQCELTLRSDHADRLKCIEPSGIRRFFGLADKMGDCINLSAGERARHVLGAITGAAESGKTHYEPTNGIPELRLALARKALSDYGLDYDPNSEIMVTGRK